MKKLESTWYNMAVVLTLISVIAGASLAWVNGLTKGPIAEIQRRNEAQAIKTVLCDDDAQVTDTVVNGDVVLYLTENGAAVKTMDPDNGSFGGGLTVMVGLDREFHVLGYTVLVSNETPGLGAKAGEWFQKGGKGDIIGRVAGQLATTKDNGEIDAITASTITSRAFLRAVNNAYAEYSKVLRPDAEVDVHTSATAVKKAEEKGTACGRACKKACKEACGEVCEKACGEACGRACERVCENGAACKEACKRSCKKNINVEDKI